MTGGHIACCPYVCLLFKKNRRFFSFPRIELLQCKKLFVLNECFVSVSVTLCIYKVLFRYKYLEYKDILILICNIFQLFFLTEKHHLKTYIKADNLHPFIRLCVKCAWISSVQYRPLSITFKLKPGSNFYPDVMISRNAPAPEVDYLVWPIVFKYDNGPLLLKGIVHCSQLKWNKHIHVFTHIFAYIYILKTCWNSYGFC